jgi:hypothetical protein
MKWKEKSFGGSTKFITTICTIVENGIISFALPQRYRFILWNKSTGWGLGNNIEGLITTILLGLLTDRAILGDIKTFEITKCF